MHSSVFRCSGMRRLRPTSHSSQPARPQFHALRRTPAAAAAAPGRRRGPLRVSAHLDYVATASDDGVLRMPPRTELDGGDITNVFGYPRNLSEVFYLGKVLGAGSFGVVREAIEVATGRRFAVKTVGKLPKRGAATPRYLLKLRAEVEVMHQLGVSLNAVYLHEVFEDDANIHMVMELCEGGALLERVEGSVYSERYISGIVRSILRFIAQCHAKGIVYRDVKPDNFLFLSNDPDSPIKATDFGLAIRHSMNEAKLTSRSGTPAYMSPELVMQCYNEKADVWSVGMLAYQLLTGRFPFWDDVRHETLSGVWQAILSKDINWDAEELRELSPSARDFLERLLQRSPAARPSAADALTHPWVAENSDEASAAPLQGSVVQRLQRFATHSHLKQLVLRMITEEMRRRGKTPKASAALQDLFAQYDSDKSGSISFDELVDGLASQGYNITTEEIRQLMAHIDLDKDGNVGSDEFMATLIDWGQVMQETEWQSYVDYAFDCLDIDRDGYIDLDELLMELPSTIARSSNSSSEDSLSPESERVAEAKRMLREADDNGDGKISREEFYNLLRSNQGPDNLSLYDARLPEPLAAKHATNGASNGAVNGAHASAAA